MSASVPGDSAGSGPTRSCTGAFRNSLAPCLLPSDGPRKGAAHRPGDRAHQPDRIELESASDLHAPEVQVSAYLAEPPPVESPSEVPMETLGVWPITIHDHELRVWSLDGTPGKKTVTLPKVTP